MDNDIIDFIDMTYIGGEGVALEVAENLGKRDSWEAHRKPLHILRALRKRLFVRSVGVQYTGDSEWSVCEPGKLIGNRRTPEVKKMEPPEYLTVE